LKTPSLAGFRVVVTRAAHQAAGLAAAFEAAGAQVLLLPLLEIRPALDPEPLRQALGRLDTFQWLIFTSTNAVEAFFATAPPSLPTTLHLAAVGKSTAAALTHHGYPEALTPQEHQHHAESLLRTLKPHLQAGHRALLPQAADARTTLAEGLARAGVESIAVTAYDKALPETSRSLARTALADGPLGWVTFTSPRIVRHFLEVLGTPLQSRLTTLRAASIGPITTAELHRHGIQPAAEATTPGDGFLVDAVIRATHR